MIYSVRLGFLAVFAALLGLFVVIGEARAGGRVALVVGNAAYEHANTLANTVNDADAVAGMLTKAGFDVVTERRNVGVVEFKRTLREFARAAENADIAVVYYAGHGMEFGGTNYLIPIDAKLASDFDVDDETISLDRIIQATQPAKKLSLIILDACRENPFPHTREGASAKRSLSVGLTRVEPASANTLIAYAAKAGSVSYDGDGPNSPFTTALVKYLAEPGVDIRIAFGEVRDAVLAATENRQEPFVYGSLGGANVILAPANTPNVVKAPAPTSAPTAVDPEVQAATDYALADRVGSREAWEAFLEAHSSGFHADLARAQLAKLAPGLPSEPEVARAGSQNAPAAAPNQTADLGSRTIGPELAAPSGTETAPSSDRGALVARIEAELRRVGCYFGADEDWDDARVKRGLLKYAEYAKLPGPPAAPDDALLAALEGQRIRVCPVECPPSEIVQNGRCVARPCPAGEIPSRGTCVARPAAQHATPPRGIAVAPVNPPKSRCAGASSYGAQNCPPEGVRKERALAMKCASGYHVDASGACQPVNDIVDSRCQAGFKAVPFPSPGGYRCVPSQ